MRAIQSKLNLLIAQRDAIIASGHFNDTEIQDLTPTLDKHIEDARNELETTLRNNGDGATN